MVDAATEFKKSGFSDEDSAQLAQIAAMYQNVADEAVSTGESANFIISQMKAFGLEAQDATHIIDALNAVSNSQAVSSADLANNIGKASSAMALGNNTYEQSLAMMTAMTEINRSGAKSARALVSVQSRLTQVLDDQSSTGQALIGIYDELGVELYDMDGQLRPTFEIFKDLAEIWPTLSTNQKDYIALTQAGSNQTQNFVALMDNFQTALDSEQTALHSTNSALDENARYMESLEAKTTALKATLQDLSNNVIDSELVGSLLTLANDVLEALNTEVGTTVTQWGLLTGVLTGGIVIFGDIGAKLISSIKAITTYTSALGAGAGAASAFVSAAFPIAGILAAVTIGGISLVKAWKDANPTLEEATGQLESINTQLQTNRERLTEINALEWNELTPEILAEKEAIEKENEELRRNAELLEQRRIKAAKKQARTGGEVATGGSYYTAVGYDDFGTKYKDQETAYIQLAGKMGVYAESAEDAKRSVQALGVTLQENAEMVMVDSDAYNAHLIVALNEYKDQLNSTHSINKDQIADFEALKSETAARVDGLKALQSEGEKLDNRELALIATYDRLIAAYDEATQHSEKMISAATQNAIAIYDEGIKAGKAKQEILDLAASQTIFNNTNLSVDEKIEALSRLAAQAGLTGFALKSLNSAFQRDIDEMGEEAAFAAYWSDITKMTKAYTNKSTTNLGTAVDSGKTTKTDKALEEFKTLQAKIKHQLEMGEIDETEYYNKLEQLVKEYKEKAIAHMKEYGLTVDKINENMYSYEEDIYKKRLELQQKAAEEAEKQWRESLEKQKSDMESAVSYLLKKIDDEISALEDAKDAINKKYDDEIQKIQDANDKLEQQIEYEEKLNQLAKAQQQQIYVFKNGQFQYMQDVDEVASAQAELDAYERERVMQAEVDSLEAKRDAEIAAIDEQIEYWNKYKDEWSGVVDQYTEEQNRLLAEQELGIDFEKANWEKRLEAAQDFADRYNSIMASLSGGYSGGTGGGGYSFSGSGDGGWSAAEMAEGFIMSSSGGSSKSSINVSKLRSEAESALAKSKATGKAIDLGGGVSIDYSKVKNKYAGGTLSSSGGLSLVGEGGPELAVLGQGDGVLPSDITRNLWDWGKFNPKSMMSTMSQVFNIDNLTLPNAHDAAGLIGGLKQMAYQRAYKRA